MGSSMLQRFKSMVSELQSNPAIELTQSTFKPPATAGELDQAGETFKLTPAMVDFYSECNGITIKWERATGKEIPEGGLAAGSIDLRPVQEVFGDWEDEIYTDEDDQYAPLHPVDFFVPEACAALYLDGSPDPEVYYHYLGEDMRRMGVNFEGYLELLLKSRGFWYWQRAVAKPPNTKRGLMISIEEQNFRKVMPELFPDFRDSDFKKLS